MAAVTTVRNLQGRGTTEKAWAAAPFPRSLPSRTPPTPTSGRLVVVAPHPDDEILGAGGTCALLVGTGVSLHLVAVTDGEASNPAHSEDLRARRPAESVNAAAALGLDHHAVHRLRHPDGAVDRTRLGDQLRGIIAAGDLVLAPWSHDGHPDHDVVGAACREVCDATGADLWGYLVWAWHWAVPAAGIPWAKAIRVELGPGLARAKAAATRCFVSQLTGPEPILPPHVLARLLRPFEVFVTS